MGISPTTAKNQFIEAMVKDGASLVACNMWFAVVAQAATSHDHLGYVYRLADLAQHIDCHPVNIITTCLTMGKYTKVDDEMMKCVWQMVSDDTDSQQETDEFWHDADGEIEIISKKNGDDDDSSSSASYEEEPACCHDVVGDCEECIDEELPVQKVSGVKRMNAMTRFSGLKRKLVPRCIDDEACEVENPKA